MTRVAAIVKQVIENKLAVSAVRSYFRAGVNNLKVNAEYFHTCMLQGLGIRAVFSKHRAFTIVVNHFSANYRLYNANMFTVRMWRMQSR